MTLDASHICSYNTPMDTRQNLFALSQAARFDVCSPAPGGESRGSTRDLAPSITCVAAPGGRQVPILKILQTSACQNNCLYCAFRAGRDFRRAHSTPDELAHGFDLLVRAGLVQGMFLSSGIAGLTRTMDQMLATAELVRGKYGFRGYLHLKLLPGAETAQIERAVALADRVSTNLEAPTAATLARLAPEKQLGQLLGTMQAAAPFIAAAKRWAGDSPGGGRLGLATQFVVGPAGETDRELLGTAEMLYRELKLARAYYSAFSPVPGTPLESESPVDPQRERRLYQADYLLHQYGFAADELPFDDRGQLLPDADPKLLWARLHPERFPVEVNRAPVAELMRVPGIGPRSARAIVAERRLGCLTDLRALARLGARAEAAAPYVLLNGRRPAWQMPLWSAGIPHLTPR